MTEHQSRAGCVNREFRCILAISFPLALFVDQNLTDSRLNLIAIQINPDLFFETISPGGRCPHSGVPSSIP